MSRAIGVFVYVRVDDPRQKALRWERPRRIGKVCRIPRKMSHIKTDAHVLAVGPLDGVKHQSKTVTICLVGHLAIVFEGDADGIAVLGYVVGLSDQHLGVVADDGVDGYGQLRLTHMRKHPLQRSEHVAHRTFRRSAFAVYRNAESVVP